MDLLKIEFVKQRPEGVQKLLVGNKARTRAVMIRLDKIEVTEEDIEGGRWDGCFDCLQLRKTLFVAVSV